RSSSSGTSLFVTTESAVDWRWRRSADVRSFPVHTITGVRRPTRVFLKRLRNSKPSISGMTRARTTAAGRSFEAALSALVTSCLHTALYPSSLSVLSASFRAGSSSSSTSIGRRLPPSPRRSPPPRALERARRGLWVHLQQRERAQRPARLRRVFLHP